MHIDVFEKHCHVTVSNSQSEENLYLSKLAKLIMFYPTLPINLLDLPNHRFDIFIITYKYSIVSQANFNKF